MRHSFLALAAVLALPALAHADIAPSPGYVEQCTVAKYTSGSRTCRECRTYHANPENYCSTQLGQGYQRACKTRGASVWTEVWCRNTDGGTADGGTANSGTANSGSVDGGTIDGGTVETDRSTHAAIDAGGRQDAPTARTSGPRATFPGSEDPEVADERASSDGGCSALGAADLPLPALLALAGLLASRRRRHPR